MQGHNLEFENHIMEELQKQVDELKKTLAALQVYNPVAETQQTTLVNSVPTVEKFSFDKADWPQWIAHYERYRVVSKINLADEKFQVTNLLLQMGPEVDKLLEKLQRNENSLLTYEETKNLFNNHFETKRNIIYERAKFNLRNQVENETGQEYIDSLILLSKKCNYGALVDELVRDRLVVGIRDHKLSEQLQLDEKLTLEKAVEKVIQTETVKEQNKEIREKLLASGKIDKVTQIKNKNKYEQENRSERGQETTSKYKNEKKKCTRCGAVPVHRFNECPAVKEKCRRCRIKGHYSTMCRTKIVKEINASDTSSSEEESSSSITEIKNIETISKPWLVNIKIMDKKVQFKVDSGADETVITTKTYKKLVKCGEVKLKNTSTRLIGPGERNELKVKGSIKVPVKWNEKETIVKMFVVKTSENLLGRPALEALEILKFNDKNIQEVKIKEEVERLITKEEVKEKFPELFEELGQVKNFKYVIKLKEGTKPVAVQTPRRVALPLLETVREELNDMVRKEVITEINEATEWCSPMVVVAKEKGVRICTDFTELNKFVVRERYLLPTVEETIGNLQNSCYFSKLDCSKGFWQLKIQESSQKYTTFITPFGRFMYKRLPFGITSGPEVFQKVLRNIIFEEGLNDFVLVHADDILVKGSTILEHNKNLVKVLSTLKKHGLTLNYEKCQIGVKEIKYLGICISQDGIKPDQSSIEAILKYPEPKNKSEVRKFLGMYTYFSKFISNASTKSQVIRELLHEKNEFNWNQAHQECFENLKREIISAPVLANYQTNRETRISADSSSYGLGGVLEQLQDDKTWRPIYFCSKTLSEAEKRYAQIEKETLALTWLSERLQQYLIGQTYTMRTDHKPLLRILTDKPIDQLTTRLQRFRMRLMKFNYKVEYVPGKEFYAPDALSRSPLKEGMEDQDVIMEEKVSLMNSIQREMKILSNYSTEEIKIAQDQDKTLEKLKSYVINGWPSKKNCMVDCLQYYKFRKDISMDDDIITYQDRIIIPEAWRKKCIKDIHAGHFGYVKCKSRAKETIWWPSIKNYIEEKIKNCEKCLKNSKPMVEPMLSLEIPFLPWQTIGTDLMELNGKTYLVIQDYYTRWPEVFELRNLKSKTVIDCLKETFSRYGIPRIVRSDNGRQFDSMEFRNFSQEYTFKWVSSSPKYPQSNGQAESAVKLLKKIMKKNEDPFKGLLAYRNTKLACGASPAQLMMGRMLRENLPIKEDKLKPKLPDHKLVKQKLQKEKEEQKKNYDNRHKANKELKELETGTRVWIVTEKKEGIVTRKRDEPRSYEIQTDSGVIRRNRRHLQPLPESEEVRSNKEKKKVTEENSETQEKDTAKAVQKTNEEKIERSQNRERKLPSYLKDYVI